MADFSGLQPPWYVIAGFIRADILFFIIADIPRHRFLYLERNLNLTFFKAVINPANQNEEGVSMTPLHSLLKPHATKKATTDAFLNAK